MRYYCVWMSNHTDHRDDEAIKVRANSIEEAKDIARTYQPNRFSIKNIYSLGDFKKFTGWSHKMATKYRCK